MAKIFRCDGCGKIMERKEENKVIFFEQEYDICKQCMWEIDLALPSLNLVGANDAKDQEK